MKACVSCAEWGFALSHISMSSPNFILFFLRLLNRCPVSFRYWIITFLSAVVPGGRMDTENCFGQHVKPIRTIVFLLVSFGWGVVGFWPSWGIQTSLRDFESHKPMSHPVRTCETQEMQIHVHWTAGSEPCSTSLSPSCYCLWAGEVPRH